ncbi:hypothetical protein IMG5_047020, partial [Ichthyophthirius multifiliis]
MEAQDYFHQLSDLFRNSNYTYNVKDIEIEIKDTQEYRMLWQQVSVSKNFPSLKNLTVKSLGFQQ